MDQSYSESDISLSPSQILERLQVLRQLQLLQRGKLQKQRLEYQETPENSSSATEIVSQFSNSTSYNTFRSLLQSSHDSSNEASPRLNICNLSKKVKELDLIEGVSVLNLSQESEFIVNTPVSSRGRISATSQNSELCSPSTKNCAALPLLKKQIALDDMPILTPKKDFEALVLEKLLVEKKLPSKSSEHNTIPKSQSKRPFLKRGEGMSRFGLRKKDLVIQSTKALPWHKQSEAISNNKPPVSNKTKKLPRNEDNMVRVEISVAQSPKQAPKVTSIAEIPVTVTDTKTTNTAPQNKKPGNCDSTHRFVQEPEHSTAPQIPRLELTKAQTKNALQSNKGKTWAAVLTTEQNDFLRQLKQSEYYKNFVSPTKSTVSDASCDETLTNVRHEREIAEQNMFELLENKVSNESFNLENSFFNRFFRQTKLECTGESTPLVLQQCLAKNPDLMHLYPDIADKRRNENSQSDAETCNSECTDCCSETCSSVSSCCSCKTMEETNNTVYSEKQINQAYKGRLKKKEKETQKKEVDKESNKEVTNDTSNQNDNLQVNLVEMNAKLIATSDLLKDRLRELEDEIETFRQENANLTKMREEIDGERQKFYEEKASFEQKFNEEKILSEYYLAEEKEKLTKQKQMYDKYVREIRGRLNKKDKDEVLNLRKEVNDLKEEMRLKDAKSTSTIARLRNQLKLMEKEKKDFQDQIEKLKKENRRIQHSNDMTRRMTNIKYLEQINKKLSNMTAKDTRSEVNLDRNAKYKTFEIERQSRSRRVQHNTNEIPLTRTRAKSVPNLKVTSRYAKYFSQRDVVSDFDRNNTIDVEPLGSGLSEDNDDDDYYIENEIIQINNGVDSMQSKDNSEHEENNLEKLYMDRFHSISPRSLSSNPSSNYNNNSHSSNPDTFFISKSNATLNRISSSPSNTSSFNNSNNSNRSKSPTLTRSQRSSDQRSPRSFVEDVNPVKEPSGRSVTNISRGSSNRQSKSPISILTNRSSSIQNPGTVIHNLQYRDNLSLTPDTAVSKTSLTKTNLNPTEIRKPDGSRELRFPNGNVKFLSADGKYSRFIYYNGDIKENFLNEGRIKYYYAETKTYHTTHADGLEVLEFPDGQVEKRYKDGSSEIRLPNGSIRYFDPKNEHVREEWRFPDGAALTVSAEGDQRIVFSNGQVEVHAKDHKRREFPDGTVKLVYTDGTAETRYASGRVRIKDKLGNLIMDSTTG